MDVVLHVLATYCGHLQGVVFRRIYYKEHQILLIIFGIFSSAGMHRDLKLTSTKKLASTDTINFSSNHPRERKLAAYIHLTNRMHT
jgi:hypothetical protein